MEKSPVIVRILDAGEVMGLDQLEELYRVAGWIGEGDDVNFLRDVVRNSALFAGAFHEAKLVGIGRALSDQVSDAYLQDIVVLPQYRKQGVGGRIVTLLVSELRRRNVDWIGLVGEPGTLRFYKSLGFEVMNDFVPMRYQSED